MVKKISEKEFSEVTSSKIAVVDFSATWCGPCKMLAPVLEELSGEMEDVAFFNVDVDENNALASQFSITNIPALVVLKDGKKTAMQVGFQPKPAIKSWIESQK